MFNIDFSALQGETISKIDAVTDLEEITALIFHTVEGRVYKLYHQQECCEKVYLMDIVGNLAELVGSKIMFAQLETNSDPDLNKTWSFYKLRTLTSDIVLRWVGESNGCYSQRVNFVVLKPEKYSTEYWKMKDWRKRNEN